MAKINVTLRCQMDSGKEVKMPGEAVSMEENEARKLAAMGMVELPDEKSDVKQSKKRNAAAASGTPPSGDNGDTDNADEDNGEGA